MTRGPQIAHPGQLAVEALALMTDRKITQLFVLDAGTAASPGRRAAYSRLPACGAVVMTARRMGPA